MNWTVLKSLNEIYETGKTKKKISLIDNPDVRHLIKNTKELGEFKDDIVKLEGFDTLYQMKFLLNYNNYLNFLKSNNLLKPQTRFHESDINVLMDLDDRMKNRELEVIRDQIISNEETVRGVSQMFFRDEKYLEGKLSLVGAVKQILQIESLANDKDQQYLYVLGCKAPERIVLCENLDFLKRPTLPRANNIELWYAGGKNIAKLDHIDARGLPIYYSGDWDYDGLKIFEAVKQKLPEIKLLIPNGLPREISTTNHLSLWKNTYLSGLDKNLFVGAAEKLITRLIENDQWIIEESNDLLRMLGLR
ncbi:Wadjet anti-phage system protein JetD domain-containing protein [Flavobacterium sangjuense]|uniref:Wadjet protein JetD C-terminal domain-containing protein n=1 Tax=Flavobacterium sangjuense TaxID=2518177 RepID=A0A4P7PV75_9FLAO|nr:Wadjet anti-phage system protein JetD domain-containing protein [Flavobacterium sangjuense]QBZ98878.1 hypothetical protein GS03_02390 [Flavobacterium sangjuense]